MLFERAITPKITIGDQPTEADLARLKAEGYTGVVNLRNDGEPEQPWHRGRRGEGRGAGDGLPPHGGRAARPDRGRGSSRSATSSTPTTR